MRMRAYLCEYIPILPPHVAVRVAFNYGRGVVCVRPLCQRLGSPHLTGSEPLDATSISHLGFDRCNWCDGVGDIERSSKACALPTREPDRLF